MFSRPGSMGAALLSPASGLAGTLALRSGRKKAGGLPMNVIVAVTDESVAIWDRGSVRVTTTEEGTLADRLAVQLGDGEAIQLDSNKMPGFKSEFNEPLIRMLGG